MKINRQSERGIALIVVMIAIAVLSILAATFALAMKVETKLAMNSSYESDLFWAGVSGVQKARYILAMQMKETQEPWDSLNQIWAGGPGSWMNSNSLLSEITMDGEVVNGSFVIEKIVDLERKFNINMADEAVLNQALRLAGVDPGDFPIIAGSILDWMDPDENPHIGGTESDFYQGMDPPYFSKNRPMDDISELLLINNITPDLYSMDVSRRRAPPSLKDQAAMRMGLRPEEGTQVAGLSDLLTTLSSGRINVNTASAVQLQMLPFVDEFIAAEIIRVRSGPDGADGTADDTPFRAPGELATVINNQLAGQVLRYADTRSRTFEVTVKATVGGYTRRFVGIIGRNSPTDLQILVFHPLD